MFFYFYIPLDLLCIPCSSFLSFSFLPFFSFLFCSILFCTLFFCSSLFFPFLIYSFLFFSFLFCLLCRRFHLRGAQHVIFYSLPEYAHFYPEIVNGLGDTDSGGLGLDISCLVLFTQYEKMALERMVGAKRCAHILSSNKTTFMFC